MKVNFINSSYRRFYAEHRDELVAAFEECASQGDFMLRQQTRDFEKNLADYLGTKYAISTNSGTDSIFLSLLALDVGPGDEVITVSHTFIATIQAIIHTGAKPILVDVKEDGLMDMECVEREVTRNTKVVIPVHLSGKVCDMAKLYEICIPRKIEIIEDTCQALGAEYETPSKLAKAGTMSTTSAFSFNFPKMMGCYGDGGASATADEELYQKLLLLRNHWNITQGSVKTDDYPPPDVMGFGWKSRMDNIQAAILNVKFKYYDQMLARRREIAEKYNKAFSAMPHDIPFTMPIQQKHQVYQEYILRAKDRDGLVKFMQDGGIELLVRDKVPNHKLKGLNLEHFKLPVTEEMATDTVRLPVFPELLDEEVDYIIKKVGEYYDE